MDLEFENIKKWLLNNTEDLKKIITWWSFSLKTRKWKVIKDLACTISELFYKNSDIYIKDYKKVFKTEKVKQNETDLTRWSEIFWTVIWLNAKKDWNSFSVTAINHLIQKEVNWIDSKWIRSYMLTDLNGIYSWVKILSDDETLKNIIGKETDNVEITEFTNTFVDQRRWPSIFGSWYIKSKMIFEQLNKEKRMLKKILDEVSKKENYRNWFKISEILWNSFWLAKPVKETYIKVDDWKEEEKIKIEYLSVTLTEFNDKNKSYKFLEKNIFPFESSIEIRKKYFRKYVERYKFLKDYIQILNFNLKATEISFNNFLKEKNYKDIEFSEWLSKKIWNHQINYWKDKNKFIMTFKRNWVVIEIKKKFKTEKIIIN